MANISIKENVILNVIKQMLSIMFPLISFPYISRVLGAKSYGIINYCASIVTYFSLFASLGIQNYAVREGAMVRTDKKRFEELSNQLYTVNMMTSSILFFILFFFSIFINRSKIYRPIFIIQGLVIPLTWFGSDWINTVYEDYRYITLRYLLFQTISMIAMFILVKKSDDYIKYVCITTFAQGGPGLLNFLYIRKKHVKIHPVFKNINLQKHLKSMIVMVGIILASTIYINADTTMIGFFCGDISVGLYSSATKIYSMIKMLFNALVVAIIPRISSYLGENRKNEYDELINTTVQNVGCFVVPCMIGLFILSDWILIFACGVEYESAAMSLRILSIALLFAPFSYVYASGVLVANRKEKVFLYATVGSAVLNILLNIILIPTYGIDGAAFTTLISELLVFIITSKEAKKLFNVAKSRKWLKDTILGSICMTVIVCGIRHYINNNIIVSLIASVLAGVIVYGFFLIVVKNTQLINLISSIKRKKRNVL